MSWRSRLRPASFRGVGFSVTGHEGSGGRDLAVHNHPNRDGVYAEDLGRKGRVFRVDAFIVGHDYDRRRDELIEALEVRGPGVLVHPFRGDVTVAVPDFSWAEEWRNGRVVHFTLECLETRTLDAPSGKVDTVAAARREAEGMLGDAQASFEDTFQLASLPDFVASAATNFVSELVDVVDSLPLVQVAGTIVDGLGTSAQRAVLAARASALVASTGGTPAAIADAIVQLVQTYREASADTGVVVSGLARLSSFAELRSIPTGGTRIKNSLQGNELALVRLVEQVALSQRVEALSFTRFDSANAAQAARNALVEDLSNAQTRAADVGDDRAYLALRRLGQSAIADLTARAASLSPLVAYESAGPLPMLALSHALYGTASAADDLAARNSVVHPMFGPRSGFAPAEDGASIGVTA
ncbi:DNA circularization protein [Pyruvatibacter sp.]